MGLRKVLRCDALNLSFAAEEFLGLRSVDACGWNKSHWTDTVYVLAVTGPTTCCLCEALRTSALSFVDRLEFHSDADVSSDETGDDVVAS